MPLTPHLLEITLCCAVEVSSVGVDQRWLHAPAANPSLAVAALTPQVRHVLPGSPIVVQGVGEVTLPDTAVSRVRLERAAIVLRAEKKLLQRPRRLFQQKPRDDTEFVVGVSMVVLGAMPEEHALR